MASLPVYSGKEVVRIFGKAGWQLARQRGSHIILVKAGSMVTLSVPDHREIAKGTLRGLIRSSAMTPEEFLALAERK
jgi:predicted RNA binding protein YcfA (HicA-like mRNA interferase family)